MNIWKKAASAGLSATLLASLLATAIAPSVFAAGTATPISVAANQDGSPTTLPSIVLNVGAAGDLAGANPVITLTATAGFTFTATQGTATPSANGILRDGASTAIATAGVAGATKTITTVLAAGNTATGTITIAGLSVVWASGTTATITATASGGGTLGSVLLYNLTVGTPPSYRTTSYLSCTSAIIFEPTGCSQVADGISTVTLTGLANGGTAPAGAVRVQISGGGSFIAIGAPFVLASTTLITAPAAAVTGGLITIQAPAAAGTSTVTFSTLDGFGTATAEGTLTITWTATSGLGVSVANSVVKVVANAGTCAAAAVATPSQDKSADGVYDLCVKVLDGNGNAVANTASVAVTITPVGLVGTAEGSAGTAQAASENTASGVSLMAITGSGIAGTATISVSVTYLGTTTSLGTKTVIFTGAVASVAATAVHTAVGVGLTSAGAVTFITKDATGNRVASSASTVVTTGTVFTSPVNGAAVTGEATSSTAGSVTVICGATAGTGTIAIKSNSITSNAITVNCSGAADTYTVAFDKTTVIPGGTATITVTVKDANGLPAPDGQVVTVLVSAGAVLDTNAVATHTANGVATWTFLAPFNTGVVTVLASSSVVTTVSPVSASINVSTPVVVSAASAASALGATTAGPFTTTTKVAALGKYVTVKMSFGASAAGATVVIWTASKNSAGVWSAFTAKTSRIANSNGDVYYYFRSSSAAWLSIQGRTASASAPARQARWK